MARPVDQHFRTTGLGGAMEDYDVRSAASILASVKEQEARFERLTRALEEERRNVSLQLERANLPAEHMAGCTTAAASQPLAWQQVVMQVKRKANLLPHPIRLSACLLTARRSHPSSSPSRPSILMCVGSCPELGR